MALRKISEAEVDEVLSSYNVCLPGKNNCTNFYKVIEGRRIRVTVAADNVTIVTVTEEMP